MAIEISTLLEKYKNVVSKEEIVIEEVLSVLQELNIPCEKEEISYIRDTLYFNTDPLTKSRIFIKREMIKKKLEEKFQKKAPKKIR